MIRFANPIKKAFGLAPIGEDVSAEGQGPHEVEGMAICLRMSPGLVAQPSGLLREALHPEQLARIDLDESAQIVPRQLDPPLGALRVVQRESPVSLFARFDQPTAQKVLNHASSMS